MRRRDDSSQPNRSLPRWLGHLTNQRFAARSLAWGISIGGMMWACGSGPDETDDDPDGSGGASSGGETSAGGSMGGDPAGTGGMTEPTEPPAVLSETGLYAGDGQTLAEGVRPFSPNYALWSDSATKQRWIYLPPGQQIDTSDMEFWEYPIGTKLWKEFTRDEKRVETRLLQKRSNGQWWMMAYQWRDDESDADAVPDGVENASGTAHDIPSSFNCTTCHSRMRDKVLGFTAIQLDDEGGMGGAGSGSDTHLSDLVAEDLLTDEPGDISFKGSAQDLAVLGYLHANCGTCHNTSSSVQARVDMNLWLSPDPASLASLQDTPTYKTTVGASATVPEEPPPGTSDRIVPGNAMASNLFGRLNSRGQTYSMPPLGTEDVDVDARDMIAAWINELPPLD